MTRTARLVTTVAAAMIVFPLLVGAAAGLPPFGEGDFTFPDQYVRAGLSGRHITNAVTAIVYDIRGFDSLGEEMILFGSVAGVILLLEEKSSDRRRRGFAASSLVRASSVVFVAILFIFGAYLTINGHLSMGGGFQGGVAAFGGISLIYLSAKLRDLEEYSGAELIELLESAGGALYAVVGVSGMFVAGSFLTNWLPLGRPGRLLSGGMVPLISGGVGLEVAAGFTLLLVKFASQLDDEAS